LDYNLLFRWFLDMSLDDAGLDQSNFSRLRERLLSAEHLREHHLRPYIARIEGRHTPGLDARTTRHASYRVSQRTRKRIEEIFGWLKTVGGMRKSRVIGIARTQMQAYRAASAYNLLRMARQVPIST
jgi:IS5 family transposase